MIFVDEYFFEFILLLDLNDVRKFDCIFLKIYVVFVFGYLLFLELFVK